MEKKNEDIEMSLRYKGEDYKDCIEQLEKEKFTRLSYSKWQNPKTGSMYKFVISREGEYVVRLENITSGSNERIETHFADKNIAICAVENSKKRFKKIQADDAFRKYVYDRVLKDTPQSFLSRLKEWKAEGSDVIEDLYLRINNLGKPRPDMNCFLYYKNDICYYENHEIEDAELLGKIQLRGETLYFYRARDRRDDLILSMLCWLELMESLGESRVKLNL